MNFSTTLKASLLAASVALACGSASAGVIQVGGDAGGSAGKMSTKVGVCSFTFDAASSCGATVAMTGQVAGSIVSGSSDGQYAAPAGDTSQYLTISPSAATPITFTLTGSANYFGFFAGSLDSFNLVQFYIGNTLVDSFTGTDINQVAFGTSPTGNKAQAQYIDYFPTSTYNKVVLSSSGNAFELDNLAIGNARPNGVPEPESVALLGLGVLGLVAARRRRA